MNRWKPFSCSRCPGPRTSIPRAACSRWDCPRRCSRSRPSRRRCCRTGRRRARVLAEARVVIARGRLAVGGELLGGLGAVAAGAREGLAVARRHRDGFANAPCSRRHALLVRRPVGSARNGGGAGSGALLARGRPAVDRGDQARGGACVVRRVAWLTGESALAGVACLGGGLVAVRAGGAGERLAPDLVADARAGAVDVGARADLHGAGGAAGNGLARGRRVVDDAVGHVRGREQVAPRRHGEQKPSGDDEAGFHREIRPGFMPKDTVWAEKPSLSCSLACCFPPAGTARTDDCPGTSPG